MTQGIADANTGASTVAKCYRFLRTVLNPAVDDELIRKKRIGHASTRAALIYQHATRKRDHEIAAAPGHSDSHRTGGDSADEEACPTNHNEQ